MMLQSVDCPKIILFQHGTTSKIILKNFTINTHEAMLQQIAAFVCCNRRAAATVAGRKFPRAAGACATNSVH